MEILTTTFLSQQHEQDRFGLLCLMSHSVIFQLYSDHDDRTVVQSSNLDLLAGTHTIGSKGAFTCRAYPNTGPGHLKRLLTSLPSDGPHAKRVHRESNPMPPRQAKQDSKVCVKCIIMWSMPFTSYSATNTTIFSVAL